MNITLRKATIDDMPQFVLWRNDENVKRYYLYQEDFTVDGQKQWYRDNVLTGKAIIFLIINTADDTPIGVTSIKDIDADEKTGEYGIFLGTDAPRGKGIGTAAAKLTIEAAFTELGLEQLTLRVLSDNERAVKSYEKAGFILDEAKGYRVMIKEKYCRVATMYIRK